MLGIVYYTILYYTTLCYYSYTIIYFHIDGVALGLVWLVFGDALRHVRVQIGVEAVHRGLDSVSLYMCTLTRMQLHTYIHTMTYTCVAAEVYDTHALPRMRKTHTSRLYTIGNPRSRNSRAPPCLEGNRSGASRNCLGRTSNSCLSLTLWIGCSGSDRGANGYSMFSCSNMSGYGKYFAAECAGGAG